MANLIGKAKDQSIETLRGIAILLVVAGYIIRVDIIPLAHAHPSWMISTLNLFEYLLSSIRMPLFTVISAYLYADMMARWDTYPQLVSGKFRRIFIPFLTISTLQFILFSVSGSTESLNEIWGIYIWPTHQFWFLYSIFEIFILVGLLDSLRLLSTPGRYLIVCLIAMHLHISYAMTHAFSIFGVNYLFPFFLLGYGIRRYSHWFSAPKNLSILTVIFLISFFIKPIYYGLFDTDLPFHIKRTVGLVVAFSGIPLLFHLRRPVPVLAALGTYAFGIYLFHRLSVWPVRLAFQGLGIDDPLTIFVCYVAGGVGLAILMEMLFVKSDFTRRWLLGLRAEKPETFQIKPLKTPYREAAAASTGATSP